MFNKIDVGYNVGVFDVNIKVECEYAITSHETGEVLHGEDLSGDLSGFDVSMRCEMERIIESLFDRINELKDCRVWE